MKESGQVNPVTMNLTGMNFRIPSDSIFRMTHDTHDSIRCISCINDIIQNKHNHEYDKKNLI